MRAVICFVSFLGATVAIPQDHSVAVPLSLRNASFMIGQWSGQQKFNNPGTPMQADVTTKIAAAVGGRYFEERISGFLPNRGAFDTLHILTYDRLLHSYKAWWFNDTSVDPLFLQGNLEGNKLVMLSAPSHGAGVANSVFRVTYESPDKEHLTYKLELSRSGNWQTLFTTNYSRKK
jgi:hypothetical protein